MTIRVNEKCGVATSQDQVPSKISANGTGTDHENSHCVSLPSVILLQAPVESESGCPLSSSIHSES
jgi:hypothetical protein